MPTLDQAKADLKAKVNDFKERVYPAMGAASREKAAATLNAAALAASESQSLDEVQRAAAELDKLGV